MQSKPLFKFDPLQLAVVRRGPPKKAFLDSGLFTVSEVMFASHISGSESRVSVQYICPTKQRFDGCLI